MNKYFINGDLDRIICDMLDPPTILTVENACIKEYIWFAEWILLIVY